MRNRLPNNRKVRKTIRRFASIFRHLFDRPVIKPALIVILSLSLLLLLAPWLLAKFTDAASPSREGSQEAAFELIDVPDTITIYRTEKNRAETIGFEDYVKGVVAGEMPASFHEEALKAQSVAARSYSLARVLRAEKDGNPADHPQAPLCDTVHCQVYRSEDELEALKGKAWMKKDWKKICKAADETKGQLLYYQGQLVEQALFHSSSGGRTENAEDVFAAAVPYLVSVDSPYEEDATHQNEENAFSLEELTHKLQAAYPTISFGALTAGNIKIISRSKGGRVEKMQIGSGSLTGRQVREALGLPSANFTIDIRNGIVTFTSNGSGHGVGMSQYGANGMAKNGYDYKEILNHYYKGTAVY